MVALDLAVGLWSAGSGLLYGGAGGGAWVEREPGPIARPVVGDDAFAGDAELGEPGCGSASERGGGVGSFVVEDLAVDQAGAVRRSARNRSRHLQTVLGSTWNRSGVASTVLRSSSTTETLRRRPSGVSTSLARRVQLIGGPITPSLQDNVPAHHS